MNKDRSYVLCGLESGLEQGLRASLKEMNTRESAYKEHVDDCFVATHEVIDHVNRSYIGQKEGSRLIYGYKTKVALQDCKRCWRMTQDDSCLVTLWCFVKPLNTFKSGKGGWPGIGSGSEEKNISTIEAKLTLW
jgi:hypothetical protein